MFDCSPSVSTPLCYYYVITTLLLRYNYAITMLDATTAITGEGQRFFLVHYENFVVTQTKKWKENTFFQVFNFFLVFLNFLYNVNVNRSNNKANIPVKHRTSTLTTN